MPQCAEVNGYTAYLPTFSDKAGMCFANLLNMALLICHHYISSPGFPRRGEMLYPRSFLMGWHLIGCWSNVLFTEWECKALTKRLLAAPLAHSSQCLRKQNSAAGLPTTPAIDTGLKGIGWDFRTACKALSGKERGVCICCRASASSFSLEEVRSSPTQCWLWDRPRGTAGP